MQTERLPDLTMKGGLGAAFFSVSPAGIIRCAAALIADADGQDPHAWLAVTYPSAGPQTSINIVNP